MISISTIISDANGNLIFKELKDSDVFNKSARVTRTATLDGGVYINHSGYTDGDRTLKIKALLNKEKEDILTYIFESFTKIILSIAEGIYIASISYINLVNGTANITILIEKKEN